MGAGAARYRTWGRYSAIAVYLTLNSVFWGTAPLLGYGE